MISRGRRVDGEQLRRPPASRRRRTPPATSAWRLERRDAARDHRHAGRSGRRARRRREKEASPALRRPLPFCRGSRERGLFLLALLADAALSSSPVLSLHASRTWRGARRASLTCASHLPGPCLRAHLRAHAIAPSLAFLAFAGLARLLVRGLGLGDALLAGLRVFRLRAVEAPLGLAVSAASDGAWACMRGCRTPAARRRAGS